MIYNKKAEHYNIISRNLYGMAEFYGGGAFVIINTFFAVFLTKAMGMPTALAGIIPLVGKVWDAVTDPMMGNITDRTVSRFGPKRFYIMLGGIISAITFSLMWITIPTDNVYAQFVFYIIMYCLFSTGFTIIMVPYNGLLPDMIDDYGKRASFSNVRTIWSTLGAMVAGMVPSLLIKNNKDASSYLMVGILFGVIFCLTSLVTFFGTWEKKREPVKTGLMDSFTQAASVYKSRSFRLFVGIYLTGQCGMDFVSGMAVYYVDDVLGGYEKGYLTYLLAVLLLSQFVGMLFWGPVMSIKSKRFTLLMGAPIRIAATLGLFFVSSYGANIVPILILTAGIGIGNAATLTSIFAILADMADVDELITSIRRPGTVSGMATFARKISAGLSAAAIGWLLGLAGYDSTIAKAGGMQSTFTRDGIALIFILVPVILVAGLIVFGVLFPIAKREFKIVQTEIARRKGENQTAASEEEKKILEKVTGLKYEKLWNPENARFERK